MITQLNKALVLHLFKLTTGRTWWTDHPMHLASHRSCQMNFTAAALAVVTVPKDILTVRSFSSLQDFEGRNWYQTCHYLISMGSHIFSYFGSFPRCNRQCGRGVSVMRNLFSHVLAVSMVPKRRTNLPGSANHSKAQTTKHSPKLKSKGIGST